MLAKARQSMPYQRPHCRSRRGAGDACSSTETSTPISFSFLMSHGRPFPLLRLAEVIAARDPEDIQRARSLAAKKGLQYQTYLKMLLHEALENEERRAS
jgi:hypothetical protein